MSHFFGKPSTWRFEVVTTFHRCGGIGATQADLILADMPYLTLAAAKTGRIFIRQIHQRLSV